MKKIHRIIIFLILFFLTSIILSLSVSANGVPYSQSPEPTISDGIITFAFNFPINLFILSIIVMIFYIRLNYLKNLSINRLQFMIKVLTVGLIITFFGALIDEFFVGGPSLKFMAWVKYIDYGNYWYMQKYGEIGYYDKLSIVLALLLIFISVFLVCKYLLKFKKKHSFLSGIIFIIFNVISWYTFITVFVGQEIPCILIFIMISIPLSLLILLLTSLVFERKIKT